MGVLWLLGCSMLMMCFCVLFVKNMFWVVLILVMSVGLCMILFKFIYRNLGVIGKVLVMVLWCCSRLMICLVLVLGFLFVVLKMMKCVFLLLVSCMMCC